MVKQMRIIEEDLVDWEPLRIRFVPKSTFPDPTAFARDVEEWLRANAEKTRSDCDLRYWDVSANEVGAIEAVAEHLTKNSLQRLARHIAKRHPELDQIVIGERIDGAPTGLSFDWVLLPEDEIQLDGVSFQVDSVAIPFTPVTIGQFVEFMEATAYIPVPDRIEFEGFLVDNFRFSHGKSPKLPLFGVTYDDAVAYCEWARLRLPTEPELHHFFKFCVTQEREFQWSGECWTSTSTAADVFVVRDGPYHVEAFEDSLDRYRKTLHRHHYQLIEAPCFRVARTLDRAR